MDPVWYELGAIWVRTNRTLTDLLVCLYGDGDERIDRMTRLVKYAVDEDYG